jgi:hypothetical protein
MLPRARDLNRCFKPPFDDAQGVLAEEILEILRLHVPEAVVDMHNTSGSGPAFGVCTFMDRQHEALVSLFTQRLIISSLGLGALMEISEDASPTVTVEVGGRLDDEAHELAYEGLCRYFQARTVLAHEDDTDWGLDLLRNPIRLELLEHVTLTYADGRIAVIKNSRRAVYGYDQRVEVLGSEGLLQAQNMLENTVVKSTTAGVSSAKPTYFFLERYMPAYKAEWAAFVEAVQGKSYMPVNLYDGVAALAMAEAATRSAQTGQPVALADLTENSGRGEAA